MLCKRFNYVIMQLYTRQVHAMITVAKVASELIIIMLAYFI